MQQVSFFANGTCKNSLGPCAFGNDSAGRQGGPRLRAGSALQLAVSVQNG